MPLPAAARVEQDWRAAFAQLSALHEAQRRQAASVVHDRIGQALAAIKMSAHLCLGESDPVQAHQDLDGIMASADQTANELRSLERLLRPPQLDSVGLEAAVRAEAERRFGGDPGVTLELLVEVLPQPPSPDIAIGCIRILERIFDSISAAPGLAQLTVSLQGLDSTRFVVRVHAATSGRPAWADPQWTLLPQAMAACLDGAFCIGDGDASQTGSVVLPYRLGGDGSAARAVATGVGPGPA
jgi:glucose-6-phosphate-specific signal transduction histidine kinase